MLPAYCEKRAYTVSRLHDVEQSTVFCRGICTSDLVKSIAQGRQIITDNVAALPSALQSAQNYAFFVLVMTAQNAYNLCLDEVIKTCVYRRCPEATNNVDNITTAVHEAFKNALLWSALELTSVPFGPRPLEFEERIKRRLSEKPFCNRYLRLAFYKNRRHLEVAISVEGALIQWRRMSATSGGMMRGTAIIQSLANDVVIDNNQRTIRLYFEYD